MNERLLVSDHSPAFLPADSSVRRLPRRPRRRRLAEFDQSFEGLALVYDCFWHADGGRILLVGPPPMNLKNAVAFYAEPSGEKLRARIYASVSVAITELRNVPEGTKSVRLTCADHEFLLPVRENLSPRLAGRNLVFTMSRDNDLAWIKEWANYHARVQGADSVVLFDNGSIRYAPAEIEATLLAVPGLAYVAVQSWPYLYGKPDPAILNNPFYTLFLQIASMSVVLRRYGARAQGILNCDIDELVATPPGTNIFALAAASPRGLVVMRGRYIEPVPLPAAPPGGRTHRHYGYCHPDPKKSSSPQRKWAIDPSRPWFGKLKVHPYMHWIEGRPLLAKSQPKDVFYRHFRAIHNGWKDSRADAGSLSGEQLILDQDFLDLVRELAP